MVFTERNLIEYWKGQNCYHFQAFITKSENEKPNIKEDLESYTQCIDKISEDLGWNQAHGLLSRTVPEYYHLMRNGLILWKLKVIRTKYKWKDSE